MESQLGELTQQFESERHMREYIEKQKKDIEKSIGQQGTILDEKHSKIEQLTNELGKYEAELLKLRNK